ncbi:MAG: SLBB domain-containing protein [Armatimonadia bacterium]
MLRLCLAVAFVCVLAPLAAAPLDHSPLQVAQAPVAPAAAPAATAAGAPTVLFGQPLQPGDTILITVAGEPLITGPYTVREDGRLMLPMIGDFQAAGFTPTQFADRLATALRRYVKNPIVSANATTTMPRSVTILGDVPRPGIYDQRQTPTLLSLLAVCGGPTPTTDWSRSSLIRKGEVALLAVREGNLPQDAPLQAGDVISVASKGTPTVQVVGAVKVSGEVPLTKADSAAKLALISGLAPDADPSAASILRGDKRIPSDLSALVSGQATPPEVPLQPGDILVVPQKAESSIYLLGDVKTSGVQPLTKPTRATAALAAAGGLLDTADGAHAYILRNGERVPLNLVALLQSGSTASDPMLQPGDVLVVPKQSGSVYIIGEVTKPGPQPLNVAGSVISAWALAGGATELGDLRNVLLLRENETMRLDLQGLDRGDTRCDIKLQDGDRILVPKLAQQMYVLGEVHTPGIYRIQEGETLLNVIARAGGPTGAAAIGRIAIVRRLGPGAMPTAEQRAAARRARPTDPADKLEQAMQLGLNVHFINLARVQPGEAVYLAQPNDLIYIPAIKAKTIDWWQVLLTLGTALLLND